MQAVYKVLLLSPLALCAARPDSRQLSHAGGDLQAAASAIGPTNVYVGKSYPVGHGSGYGGSGYGGGHGGGYGGGFEFGGSSGGYGLRSGGGYGLGDQVYSGGIHAGASSGYTHVLQVDDYEGYGGGGGGHSGHYLYGDPRQGFFKQGEKHRGKGRGGRRGKKNGGDVHVIYINGAGKGGHGGGHGGGYDYGYSHGHVSSHYGSPHKSIGPADLIKWAYVGRGKH
ncbi:glycine-rich cell wall structural protein 1.8-like isoform X1 [Amphibalanus amphitrite]|uniref:glycine-rich cell wall structural protein 1.8-like isoform X1 n=1 Tax=Amphibalanus amphitrite TaxID=1232801 RepID=UPI001C928CD2|nr:glycine-rich cell wall structural protein 1.8-like isoform X1 [Amphibalanus amphitrite]